MRNIDENIINLINILRVLSNSLSTHGMKMGPSVIIMNAKLTTDYQFEPETSSM